MIWEIRRKKKKILTIKNQIKKKERGKKQSNENKLGEKKSKFMFLTEGSVDILCFSVFCSN
jgi:hypothetical protein